MRKNFRNRRFIRGLDAGGKTVVHYVLVGGRWYGFKERGGTPGMLGDWTDLQVMASFSASRNLLTRKAIKKWMLRGYPGVRIVEGRW